MTANKISRCFNFHKPQIWTGTVLFSSVLGLNQNLILQENTMENKKVIALYLVYRKYDFISHNCEFISHNQYLGF